MTLLNTLEQAAGMLIVSASVANDLDCNVYAGRCHDNIELPCVVCAVESAEPFIYDTGIFRCGLVIQTQERAIDTNATSNLSQAVYDCLAADDVSDKLRTYSTSSLFIYNIAIKDLRNATNTDDKSWIQECNLDVVCSLQ